LSVFPAGICRKGVWKEQRRAKVCGFLQECGRTDVVGIQKQERKDFQMERKQPGNAEDKGDSTLLSHYSMPGTTQMPSACFYLF
jgi:hypothetical protein